MLDEFKNAFQRQNNAHIQLIIINVAVFVVLAVLGVLSKWFGLYGYFQLVYEQFAIPSDIIDFLRRPWTLITYFFTHSLSDYLHIIFNMIGLYWFGKLFVEYLGSDKLITVYVLGGLAGAVVYLMTYNLIPQLPDFIKSPSLMVGASASIFAVMVAVATILPDYTFYLLLIGPVKIKYIAAVYIFISFIGTVEDNPGGDIAHLGGALIGYVYARQLQRGVNLGGWITVVTDWFKNIFSGRSPVKVTYRKAEPVSSTTSRRGSSSSKVSKSSQEEIDAILDKISDRGYESLTKEEKEKLFNASKK